MLCRPLALLLSSLLLVSEVVAFPSGAGGCPAGSAAVAGNHLQKPDGASGTLAQGNLVLTIDGEVLTPGSNYVFSSGVDHVVKLTANGLKFRGFMIRLGGAGEGGLTLIEESTTTAISPLCFTENPVASGVTHNANTRKDEIETILRVDENISSLTLDVTVVMLNRDTRSSWFYSGFTMSSQSGAPSPPTIAPANAPTISVDNAVCADSCTITIAGSSTVEPVAELWAATYSETCGNTVTVEGGGSSSGSRRVCGNDSRGESATMIGDMSRGWRDSEGTVKADGFTYDCVHGDTTIDVVQVDVAIDGLTVATKLGGSGGATCIDLLGGLTLDQLRWIFSSYTVNQLIASGWDEFSVANLDNSDSTHLWSELDTRCDAVEIQIGGADDESGTYEYFTETVFADIDNGETFRLPYINSAVDEDIVDFIDGSTYAIAYFGFAFFSENRDIFFGIPIENSDGDLIAPNAETVGNGDYNPLARRIWMNLNKANLDCTKGIIEYGMSESGVAEVEEVGYVPIPVTERQGMIDRVDPPSSGGGGGFGGICFSSNNVVDVMGKGEVSMASLKIGDEVLAANGKYETIFSFGHYSHDIMGDYIQVWTQGNKLAAELSPNHMIFVDGNAKAASSVAVGDRLDMASGESAPVTKITSVKRQGAFAPFTQTGVLAVNGVLASSYVSLQAGDSTRLNIGGFKTVSDQFTGHISQAPHRLICAINFGICQGETYTAEGMSTWVVIPLAIATWWLDQVTVVKVLVFGIYAGICALASAFEFVISNAAALLVTAAAGAYVYASIKASKKTSA